MDTVHYVGRNACAQCHDAAAEAWSGSHHDLAMAPATDASVLGDFDDVVYTDCGVTTRFHRNAERFLITTEGPAGEPGTFEVAYTFGFDPLQQYLIAMPGGRFQSFTVAWDTHERRWFSLYADECVSADDWLHWTNAGMNWNYMCADCHSTNVQRNFDLETTTYQTTYSEVDVSCEACHGPGGSHVEWAESHRNGESGEGKLPDRNGPGSETEGLGSDMPGSDTESAGAYGFAADLTAQQQQIEACAPCHSRRRVAYPDFLPGRRFLDHYEPELLHDELYFPDGQIKDEVYVYGSFLQSRMYREGVQCSDCHDPHSANLKFEGNALCTQCHEPDTYDTFQHIRHEAPGSGSECVDCHMPERAYMVVDPRRDHSFTIPRPDLTAELGVPNACTGCHDGETPQWAASYIVDWHGQERASDETAVRAVARGREGRIDAESDLIRLAQDPTKPGILRATAMFLLQGYESAESYDAARAALSDADPLLRVNAIRKLESVTANERVAVLSPLLEDSVRLVRMEAARILARESASRFVRSPQGDANDSFWNALEEYQTGQLALHDQAAAHLNLATIHESLDEVRDAERAYRTAIRLDSSFVPAHLNLAMLYNRLRTEHVSAQGRSDSLFLAAEAELTRALQIEPDLAQVHYSLGLLLAEKEGGLSDAAVHLMRAAELDPENPRMQYNAGLALQQLDRREEAEAFLLAAHDLEPTHPDYLNALSVYYAQEERWEVALDFTERLAGVVGADEAIQQRLAYVRAQMQR